MIKKIKTSTYLTFKSVIFLPFLVLILLNFQSTTVAQTADNTDKKTTEKQKSKDTNTSPWTVSVSNTSVEYYDKKDSFRTTTSGHYNANNSDTKSIKNDRVIVKINKYADLEFLEYVKTYLINKHDITITYNDLRYNDKNLLIGIDLSVVTKDGFSGALTQMKNTPLHDIYIYRDYSKNAKVAFGVGELPDFEKTKSNGDVYTSIQLAPGRKDENENFEKAESVNLENVDTYIINGEAFNLSELGIMVIIPTNYKFVDQKTFKVEGEVLKGEDLKSFFANDDQDFKEKSIISFDEQITPYFIKVSKTPPKK